MSPLKSRAKGELFGVRAALLLGLSAAACLAPQATLAQPARAIPAYGNSNLVYFGARITVDDIDKSLEFYKLIGLKVIGRNGADPNKGQYTLSPTGLPVDNKLALQFDKTKTTPTPKGEVLNELVFAVSDLDRRVDMLIAAGYKIDRRGEQRFPFSSTPPYPTSVKAIKTAFLKDPNGVSVELIQWDLEGG